ncbi:MAG TPA: hypothetical protein VLD84_10955 [Nitrososphaeraceae archaeon]|nr:hypothetical protein [Nitrososphaeraceae archaeon]
MSFQIRIKLGWLIGSYFNRICAFFDGIGWSLSITSTGKKS